MRKQSKPCFCIMAERIYFLHAIKSIFNGYNRVENVVYKKKDSVVWH